MASKRIMPDNRPNRILKYKREEFPVIIPNPDPPGGGEQGKINHENTKFGKHELFLFFRAFVIDLLFHQIQKPTINPLTEFKFPPDSAQ